MPTNPLAGLMLRTFDRLGARPARISFSQNVAIQKGTEITPAFYVADDVVREYFSEAEARQNMRDGSQLYSITVRRLE